MRIDTASIKTALRERYCAPEYAIFFEVSESTGGVSGRRADAVAMSLWPSRGLEFHGFEIKVSKGDFKNEMKKPEKAEVIASRCDYWWIVTPKGLVEADELPTNWGLLTWSGKRWSVVKKAVKTECKPLTRGFVASLLRRASELNNSEIRKAIEKVDKERRDNFEKEVEQRIKRHKQDYQNLVAKIEEFEKLSGIKISDRTFRKDEIYINYEANEIAKAINIVRVMLGDDFKKGAYRLVSVHRKIADRLERQLKRMDFPVGEDEDVSGYDYDDE